jgi:hypothetical protein
MGELFAGGQIVAAIDGPWCDRHGVPKEAVERVADA